MPYRTFAASEVLTASNVNTYLMNQAIIICTSGTRPGSPVSGMRIWQTDTQTEYGWDGSAWQFLRGMQQVVRKTADESVSNTSTIQNDDHLFISVAANSVYLIELFMITNAGTAGDLKADFTGPSGYGWSLTSSYAPPTDQTDKDNSSVGVGLFTEVNTMSWAGYGADVLEIIPSMIVVTGANAGTLQFRWTQLNSSGTASIIRAGSYLHAEKVA